MDWNEYIEHLLSRKTSFDGIKLSLGDSANPVGVPPIIKSSILMLDRMLECQGKFNILVFPERAQSIFIFTLVKLLYNISEGRIERDYDPEKFHPGEHLKLGNAVVEFMRVEERYGDKHIVLKLADLEASAPIEFFPLFQKTNAQRLCKNKVFSDAMKSEKKNIKHSSPGERFLGLLRDYRTHMDSSIVYMTSITNMKEEINNCELFGHSMKDLLLIGQTDYEGTVRNIGAGQLGGTPAIVLASDLYAICEMAQKGHPIQSIIIDGSRANLLASQLDALDELMRLGVPVPCVTDIVNSFELQPFLDRKFNLWRWDATSITDRLYDADLLSSGEIIKHCAEHKVDYLICDGNEISTAIRKISFHRGEIQNLSAPMQKLFEALNSLSFTALREIIPFDNANIAQACCDLEECSSILKAEKNYITPQLYDDYCVAIDCLRDVFSSGYMPPKHKSLCDWLRGNWYDKICIVVPKHTDKTRVQTYWQSMCNSRNMHTEVVVLHPSEYYSWSGTQYMATIVVGWLGRSTMQKILYGFNTPGYTVLMYDCEKSWKNCAVFRWKTALDNAHNREVIQKSFATDKIQISTDRFVTAVTTPPVSDELPETDEYEEIETVIRKNKYRRHVPSSGQKDSNEIVEAIPINFAGGYLAFYRPGSKVLCATNIIVNDADKLREADKKFPAELKSGDFIVVRESDRDLIREIADAILEESGKTDLRRVAGKWKDALAIETLFYTEEELYQRLRRAGCTKGFPTFRIWLQDEDVIAPNQREDLECILKITESKTLMELLDPIYEAARDVRSAHIRAGRTLTHLLRHKIVESLKKYGGINSSNIKEALELQIDGIGLVRILKVMDIGHPVMVDIADVNRLIEE